MAKVRDRLEETLARLAAREDSERVFSRIYRDGARAEADAADRRKAEGRILGPLDGRIISIKDLFDVAGEPTLAGSVVRRDASPAASDAEAVRRLREAGAVIIGKTHMTEFAFTAVGLNLHYGVPGNATDPARVPGGSSSGAAVSVAEGTSDIAIGSDTGGSVRIPAALNGVAGFKPTAGRVPLDGVFPLAPSLDSVGPLARSIADCILADAVMAGEPPLLPQSASLAGLRIGLPEGLLLADMDAQVSAAFGASLRALAKAGVRIVSVELNDLIMRLRDAASIGSIAGLEASRIHAESWLGDPGADVDMRVKKSLSARIKVPDAALATLMRTRDELLRAMDERLSGVDLFVTPATPIAAPPIASVIDDEIEYERAETLLLRNTQVANQFGLCSVTLPMPDMTLPAGLMLTARSGTDKALLAAALSVENILG